MANGKVIDSFGLRPGRQLARKYVVGDLLGKGWEGEVYHVTELATGVERAAKFFYPHRNLGNDAVTFYAKKLNKLRHCAILIQYHTQEIFRCRGEDITFLVSDFVEGELLSEYQGRQPGARMPCFEALHLLYALARGVEEIHGMGEYHGDLHSDNVIVNRRGLGFDVKLVDMFQWGRSTKAHLEDDVCDLVRLFYDAVGGARHYAKQPPVVKQVCRGLKRSLLRENFRNGGELRRYLENLDWS